MSLLAVRDLHTTFPTPLGNVRACCGVSFDIKPGEVLGIVGESGSGKTVAALSILGLVPHPGVIEHGSILFDGAELVGAREAVLARIRGHRIGMVFQDAGRALDPVHTVATHLREAGGRCTDLEALLSRVGLSAPVLRRYPHQLSGGQRQRVMIAIAIARNPQLLIADEPTTAVDSVTQVHVLRELVRVQRELGCALIVISHNLGLVARMADRIAAMYLGHVVEIAPVKAFVRDAQHPYSQALLQATPRLDAPERMASIPGQPDSLTNLPAGCVFHPRCLLATDECSVAQPVPRRLAPDHQAACHLLEAAESDLSGSQCSQ